jgi:hypothetical protein
LVFFLNESTVFFKYYDPSWAWWCPLVIPALRRLRQEDGKLEANLGYTGRPCSKIKR